VTVRVLPALRLATAALLSGSLLAVPPAHAAEPSFVRIVNAYAGPAEIGLAVADSPAAPLPWASATPWRPTAGGQQQVVVVVSGGSATVTVAPRAGCNTTVLVVRTSAVDDRPTSLLVTDCSHTRIPRGSARLTAVGVTVDELGPVALSVAGVEHVVSPRETVVVGQDVPAGSLEVTAGAPGTAEIYQRIEADLEPDTAYSLFYLGGGETPAHLLLLEDGRQAPDPPAPEVPINTGVPDLHSAPRTPPATLAALLLAGTLLLAGRRMRRGPTAAGGRPGPPPRFTAFLLLVLALCCTACQVSARPSSSGSRPPAGARVDGEPSTTPTTTSTAPAGSGSVPTGLTIPVLELTHPLIPFATADIPRLPRSLPLQQVGWLTGSSRLGEAGTTAVIGHTTAPGRTPAPFNRLGELATGDQLQVAGDDGTSHAFTVIATEAAPKGQLPESLFAPMPVPTLLLITCTDGNGPPGTYRDNLLVTAVPGSDG
jgi:sortase (surface protein transpeptidase)